MNVLMIIRAERFSPNAVERDRAILQAVGQRLSELGHTVRYIREEDLNSPCADGLSQESLSPGKGGLILSMGRDKTTLRWLQGQQGVWIINRPEGVARCSRSQTDALMERLDTPRAPREGHDGYWLKRGDQAAETIGDVQYAATAGELAVKTRELQARGITDYVVSAHVRGDLVKFYGVRGTDFFSCHYPTDDGQSKFGDERRNGPARHYPFDQADLRRRVEELAGAVGIEVYGGDCIVRPDGSYCIIDFNDWPSFSRCREEAARAITDICINNQYSATGDGNI